MISPQDGSTLLAMAKVLWNASFVKYKLNVSSLLVASQVMVTSPLDVGSSGTLIERAETAATKARMLAKLRMVDVEVSV